jgi:type 1 glutamine amidotransferase
MRLGATQSRPWSHRCTLAARAIVIAALCGCSSSSSPTAAASPPPIVDHAEARRAAPGAELPRILVFTRTTGYRHKNIPDGVQVLRELGDGRWTVEHTEDPGAFTTENLRRFRAVVFLSTTGTVLDARQKAEFERYIRSGGGFVGIHAAADTEYEWPWYGELVGAWFDAHTPVIPATVRREDPRGAGTETFPAFWSIEDEWYRFRANPRPRVRVLLSVDDRDLGVLGMHGDHPIAWMHDVGGGRAWYTAMGHTSAMFQQPVFREHLQGGVSWAMGAPPR